PIVQPADFTARPQYSVVDFARASFENAGQKAQDPFHILGMNDLLPQIGVSHKLSHRAAIDPLGSRIEVQYLEGCCRLRPDNVIQRVEDAIKPLFAFTLRRLLCLHLLYQRLLQVGYTSLQSADLIRFSRVQALSYPPDHQQLPFARGYTSLSLRRSA